MRTLDFNDESLYPIDDDEKSGKGSDEENDFLTKISEFFLELSSNFSSKVSYGILEKDDEDEEERRRDISELDYLPTIMEVSNEDDENESPPRDTETQLRRSKRSKNTQITPESKKTKTADPDSMGNNVFASRFSPFNPEGEFRIPGSNIPREMMDTGLYENFRKLTEINEKLNNKKNIFYVRDITQKNIEELNSLLEEKEYYKSEIKIDINKKLTKKVTKEILDIDYKKKKDGKPLSKSEKETIINDIILIYNGDKDVKDLKNILTNKGIINEKDDEKIRKIEEMIEKDGLRKYMTEEINNKAFIEDIYGKIFDETKHDCYLCNQSIGDNIADMEHKIPAVYSLLLIDKLRHFDQYNKGKNYENWKEYKTKPENKKKLIKIYKAINTNENEGPLVSKLVTDLKERKYSDSYIDLLVANMYAYSYAHSYCNQAKLSVKFTKIIDKNTCSFCVTSNNETITKFTEISNHVYNEIKKSTKEEGAWKIAEDGSRINESEKLYKILTSEPFKKLHNDRRPIDPSCIRFKTGKIKIRMSLRSFSNIENISISSNIFSNEHIKRQFNKVSNVVNQYIDQIDTKSKDKSKKFFNKEQLFKAVKHSLTSTYHANVKREGKRKTPTARDVQKNVRKFFRKVTEKKKASVVQKKITSKIHPKKVSKKNTSFIIRKKLSKKLSKNKKTKKRKRSGASLKISSGISITEQKKSSSSKETRKRQKREEERQKNNNTRNKRKNEEDDPLRKRIRSGVFYN